MFGKTHDTIEELDGDHGFFGDEEAAAEAADVNQLRDRVEQVEAQVNSQFTSLATYAQIAQEQVELARSEARAATERSEQRLTSLVERERADRIASFTGSAPAGTAPEFSARLDALEQSVAKIRQGLDECLARQKELADAITLMFERRAAAPMPAPIVEEPVNDTPTDEPAAVLGDDDADLEPGVDAGAEHDEAFNAPPLPAPMSLSMPAAPLDPPSPATPIDGPIDGLSLED
jgi:hypothetical protein